VNFEWTQENIDKLEIMWAAGCTAMTIAEALGTTKNSIIGKKTRLGFVRADQPQPIKKAVLKRKKRSFKLVYKKPLQPKPLISLKQRECRYPVNRAELGGLHLFCARPTEIDRGYCKEHHAIVWRPFPKRIR
jgi:hypothetical protein|tara:strand:+ start:260 stop:655 length:396 start_codon:yes stop_codon:yes gene_type:complete